MNLLYELNSNKPMNATENTINSIEAIASLSEADRDRAEKRLWVAQSLIKAIIDVPLEVASAIALFDRNEYNRLAEAVFDLVLDEIYICDEDVACVGLVWAWVRTLSSTKLKSLLCWLIKNLK